jgi:hypothetical protein
MEFFYSVGLKINLKLWCAELHFQQVFHHVYGIEVLVYIVCPKKKEHSREIGIMNV